MQVPKLIKAVQNLSDEITNVKTQVQCTSMNPSTENAGNDGATK